MRLSLVVTFFAVCISCSDSAGPGLEAVTLAVFSGDQQVGRQHTELPNPLVLTAVDGAGEPVVGTRLVITPASGSGRVLEADTLTDAQGQARFRWELGEEWINTVVISLRDYPGISVTATARARYLYEAPAAFADGWETTSLAMAGMDAEHLTRMMDSLRSGHYEEVHSVVIVKNGHLAFEEYFPGHDFGYSNPGFLGTYLEFGRNTPHNTHSATKSVISALVGLAIDLGFISDVDERVFDYFPEFADYAVGGKEAITVRDMLTMTSGLEWPEWDVPVGGGLSPIEQLNASADPIAYVLSRPLLHPPGTVYNYNGGTVNVLCQLAARSAGTDVEAFADQRLFGPLGVSNYSFPHHQSGLALCHGDIYITPRDMAKFGQLFLNGGVWMGRRVISEEWTQESVAPRVSVRNFNLYWAEDYGYLWWLNDYAVGGNSYSTYKALGWGGQEIWVVPEEEMVVVFTGASYSRNPSTDHIMIRYVFPSLGKP
ncbi:MAG: serine hydrolase [Gemmatimonadota bacterium]